MFPPHLEARTTAEHLGHHTALGGHSEPFVASSYGKCFLVSSPSPTCSLSPCLASHRGGAWADFHSLVMTLPKSSRQHPFPPIPRFTLLLPESLLTHAHWSGHALCRKVGPCRIPQVPRREAHSISWSHGTR